MEKVRVKPAKLVEKLKANFERHKRELAAAKTAYKKKAVEVLKSRWATFESADDEKASYALPELRHQPARRSHRRLRTCNFHVGDVRKRNSHDYLDSVRGVRAGPVELEGCIRCQE